MSPSLEKLQKRAEKYECAYEALNQTNKELANIRANPNSYEALLSYAVRMRSILVRQQKNLEDLNYRAKKYYRITNLANRRQWYKDEDISKEECEQIKKNHDALKIIIEKDINTALGTNTRLLDQNLQNIKYIELILNFNQLYDLFKNECQNIYKADVPHEVQDNIFSRSKELEELIDRLGPLSASSTMNLPIDWEIQRQHIIRLREDVYFFKDDYSKKYNQAQLLHKEFHRLSDLIGDPNTSDEDRILNNQKLTDCKNTLNPLLKELQDGSGRVGIDINWASIIESINQGYEDVQFGLRTQTENLSELDALFHNQPSEYLHKSYLYQSKLLQQKQFNDAVNYGMDWIKSIPKETSKDDIIKMSSSFIQAAILSSNPNWSDYRKALDLQLEQRDLRLTDQKLAANPEIKSGDIGRLELIRGTLFANAGDLSFSANKCYRNCELISPDDSQWKFQEANFYISAHQWPQARATIPSLPLEAAEKIRTRIATSQSNYYGFFTDLLQCIIQQMPRLFPRLEKSQTFKTTDVCIQISARYFKELGIPFLTIEPKWPEMSLIRENIAADALDFFHERIPSKPLRQGAMIWINVRKIRSSLSQLIQSESRSIFSLLNTVSTFTSVGFRYSRFKSRTFRSICITTQKVQMDIIPLELLDRHWQTIVGFSKQLAIRTATETQFDQGSAYVDQYANYSQLALGFAIGLCAVYRFTTYHPQIWTAMIIREVQSLFHKERYQESKTLLREAQNSWHGDTPSIQLYADYIDSYETVLKLISEQDQEIRPDSNGSISRQKKVADQVLKAFGKISNYSDILEEIYYNEIIIALNLKDQERAKQLLQGNISTSVLEQIVIFIIFCVETQREIDTIWVDELIPLPYKDVIQRYREYVSLKKTQHILAETNPQTTKEERLQTIGVLLQLIKHKDGLEVLNTQLLCDQFFVYFDSENNPQANPQFIHLLKQMPSAAHKKVALTLIADVERFNENKDDNIDSSKLQKAYSLTSFHPKKLIKEYDKYLSHRKTCLKLTKDTVEEKNLRLQIIDNILSLIESDNSFSPLIADLRLAKVRIYIDTESYKEAITFLNQVDDELQLLSSMIKYLVQVTTGLYQKEGAQQATEYLTNAVKSLKELPYPNMLNVLELFSIYLARKNEAAKSDTFLNDQIKAMNDLINCVQPIRELSMLYIEFCCELFATTISKQRYEQSKSIFEQHSINRQVRLQFIGYLADHLIQQGEKFIDQNRIDMGKEKFLQLSQLFGITKHRLIISYFHLLDYCKDLVVNDNLITNRKVLESIKNLSEAFNEINYPIPLLLKIRQSNINIKIGSFEEKKAHYDLALKEYQAAAALYLEMGITNHMFGPLMNKISSLINK